MKKKLKERRFENFQNEVLCRFTSEGNPELERPTPAPSPLLRLRSLPKGSHCIIVLIESIP